MPKTTKDSKQKKEKGELKTVGITFYPSDLDNFERLKEKLPHKTKSAMIRFLFQWANDNISLIKGNGNPKTESELRRKELRTLITDLLPKEQEQTEKRFVKLETTQQEILNLVKKMDTLNEELHPIEYKKIKSKVNGLGGKMH